VIRRLFLLHLLTAAAIAAFSALPTSIAVVLRSLQSALKTTGHSLETIYLVLGALPTSLYLVMPIAAVLAACWAFRELSDSMALPVMYSMRLSVLQCAMPGLLVAGTLFAVSNVLAWHVAPLGVVWVEDSKSRLRSNVDFVSLQPGTLYSLEFDKRDALFRFRRNLDGRQFQDVFFVLVEAGDKKTVIVAKSAFVVKRDATYTVVFHNGSQYAEKQRNDIVRFQQFSLNFGRRGYKDRRPRSGKTLLEMTLVELSGVMTDPNTRARTKNLARSELTKRFAIPWMVLSHLVLTLGLLFYLGPGAIIRRYGHLWVGLAVCGLHVGLVIAVELLTRKSWFYSGLIGALILIEMIIGAYLLARAQVTARPFRSSTHGS